MSAEAQVFDLCRSRSRSPSFRSAAEVRTDQQKWVPPVQKLRRHLETLNNNFLQERISSSDRVTLLEGRVAHLEAQSNQLSTRVGELSQEVDGMKGHIVALSERISKVNHVAAAVEKALYLVIDAAIQDPEARESLCSVVGFDLHQAKT